MYDEIFYENSQRLKGIYPLFHDAEKWPKILLKSCGVNTARFLKYVWPFFNIMK